MRAPFRSRHTKDLLIEKRGANPKENQGTYVQAEHNDSQFDYKIVWMLVFINDNVLMFFLSFIDQNIL